MSVLKKLVCKRVECDLDDADLFPRKLDSSTDQEEMIPSSFQHQLEALDAFAKWTDERFRASVSEGRSDAKLVTVIQKTDDAYLVKEVQRSLRPRKEMKEKEHRVRESSVDEQVFLRRLRSYGHRRPDSRCLSPPPCATTTTTNKNYSMQTYKGSGFCSVHEINKRASIEEMPSPDFGLFGLTVDSIGHTISRNADSDTRDDCSTTHGYRASILPRSLLRKQPQSTWDGKESGKKKTRFAEVLEQQHFIPPLQQVNNDERLLTCIPNEYSLRSILRRSNPVIYRYAMSTDEETKRNDEKEIMATRKKGEPLTVSVASDEESQFSSEFSIGDLSQGSIGSVELLFNYLLCSQTESLTSSDWMR